MLPSIIKVNQFFIYDVYKAHNLVYFDECCEKRNNRDKLSEICIQYVTYLITWPDHDEILEAYW